MAVEPQFAYLVAEDLVTIPRFPRSDSAINAMARDLIRLCSSNDEAAELVRCARQQWLSWRGTAGLIEILNFMREAEKEKARGG